MEAEVSSTAPAGPGDARTDDVRVVAGKYRIVRVIGEGGFGVVYEAENTWTGRRVALKVLASGRVADPVHVQRFMREARTAASLRHPNVVDVIDLGQDPRDGTFFLVQELLVGEDLRALLDRERTLSPTRARAIVSAALRGLGAAHAAGVVHRDIKPANVFLARDAEGGETPKIIDFGVARPAERDLVGPALTVAPVGTPAYMSPEQLRAEGPVGPASDVWSVGVMLHQLLCGEHPFPSSNRAELVTAVLSGRGPDVDVTLADAPLDLRRFVRRALSFDPSARYANASAMLADLDAPAPAPRPRRDPRAVAVVIVCAMLLVAAVIASTRRMPAVVAAPSVAAPSVDVAPSVAAPSLAAPSVDVAPSVAAPSITGSAHHPHRPREVAPSHAVEAAPSVTPSTSTTTPQTPRARASLLAPGGGYPSP